MDTLFPDSKTLEYIQQQNQRIQDTLVGDYRFDGIKKDILARLQDENNIPFSEEHRGKMYHFYQNNDFPKGVYRTCSSSTYRAGNPDWKILFSVADFDTVLNDDVYLSGVNHYTLNPDKVLINLAPNGQDKEYTLEFDLSEQKIVENGFHFPAGKNHIHWKDENTLWVCPAWHEKQLTDSGYPSEVWLVERGQTFEEALPVLKIEPQNFLVDAWRYLDSQGSPIDIVEAAIDFFHKDYYIADHQGLTLLNLPKNCDIVGYLNGQLLIHLQEDWHRASHTYTSGGLLAVTVHKKVLKEAYILFCPNKFQAIETIETTRSYVVLHYLDNVKSKIKLLFWQEGAWHEKGLVELPEGTIEMIDQPWGGDAITLTVESFLNPTTLLSLDLQHNEITILRKERKYFDATPYQTKQYFAKSQDGTQIPYFWIGGKIAPNTPTLVYVYGGFSVSELPHYLGNFGKHWLEKGGAFVIANVRGGGEFGPKWHQAAQKQNKHKSVDDLIAVVDSLIINEQANSESIVIQGGSNGGLLVASTFTRIPEKIQAVISEAPLTDMIHFHQYSSGSSWLEEYGNPEDEGDILYLEKFSPLHQLKSNVSYPDILLTTGLSDDRVHPIHTLLFAKKLQECDQNYLLYTSDSGGHSGNSTQENLAKELALNFIFLYQSLKMDTSA